MRRPPSYSDSYVILSKDSHHQLSPLVINHPENNDEDIGIIIDNSIVEEPRYYKAIRFIIKCSLHIFFISIFETIFYFIYVSKSEDVGILGTVNTYFLPLINSCGNWTNTTRSLVLDILELQVNKTTLDTIGNNAQKNRLNHNNDLLVLSVIYSVVCFIIFCLMSLVVYLKKIKIEWNKMLFENILFVFMLGLYEYFFFKTIIYKYSTISTDEINQYLIDEASQCLKN